MLNVGKTQMYEIPKEENGILYLSSLLHYFTYNNSASVTMQLRKLICRRKGNIQISFLDCIVMEAVLLYERKRKF
jgi:hypothetical protein